MNASFRQVTEAMMARLTQDPSLLDAVIHPVPRPGASDGEVMMALLPPDMRKMLEQVPEEGRNQLLERLNKKASRFPGFAAARRQGPAGGALVESTEVGEEFGLGKAWHGIHYLLCGTAGEEPGPLGMAILGGTEIGPNQGYGPVRYLTVPEVSGVAAALDMVLPEQFRRGYDIAAMEAAGVYPSGWDEDGVAWLQGAFGDLRAFYHRAAARGCAMLLYMT